MLGDQPHFFITTTFSFLWGRFFDQGERGFEVIFLLLWLAFVIFLACSAVRSVRENAAKKPKSKKKRRTKRNCLSVEPKLHGKKTPGLESRFLYPKRGTTPSDGRP